MAVVLAWGWIVVSLELGDRVFSNKSASGSRLSQGGGRFVIIRANSRILVWFPNVLASKSLSLRTGAELLQMTIVLAWCWITSLSLFRAIATPHKNRRTSRLDGSNSSFSFIDSRWRILVGLPDVLTS